MYGKAACPVPERGRRSTGVWKRYCGTTAKAGGNGENKLLPAIAEGSCLLEKSYLPFSILLSGFRFWQDIGPSGTEELSTRSRVLLPDIELQPVPFQIKYCKSGDSNGGLGCSHRCDSNALVTSKEATKRD